MSDSSKQAYWAILGLGFFSLVSFGGLALWNQEHPLMRIHGVLNEEFGVNVLGTKLIKDDNKKVVEVVVELKNVQKDRVRSLDLLAYRAFELILSRTPKTSVQRLTVKTEDGQSKMVFRSHAVLFLESKRGLDLITYALLQKELGSGSEVRVIGASERGVDVEICLKVGPEKLKDLRLADSTNQYLRRALKFEYADFEIVLMDDKGEVKQRARYDKNGRKPEKKASKKPGGSVKSPKLDPKGTEKKS